MDKINFPVPIGTRRLMRAKGLHAAVAANVLRIARWAA